MDTFKTGSETESWEWFQGILNNDSADQEDLNSAMSLAVYNGLHEATELLLSRGAEITTSAVVSASQVKDPAMFEIFLRYGWDMHSKEFGPPILMRIIWSEACVKWTLEHGADPNNGGARNTSPLAKAAEDSYEKMRPILDLLISHGAKVTLEALEAAMGGRAKGGTAMVRYMIKNGADVNGKCRSRGTPLHLAVHFNKLEYVQLLLENGADVKAVNVLGDAPEEKAVKEKHLEIAAVLKNHTS